MTPITQKVTNGRLQLDLSLHVITVNTAVDLDKKIVRGQIQSFKTDKVLDAMNAQGIPTPATTTPFQLDVTTFDKLDEQVQKYVKDNIEKLVGA